MTRTEKRKVTGSTPVPTTTKAKGQSAVMTGQAGYAAALGILALLPACRSNSNAFCDTLGAEVGT